MQFSVMSWNVWLKNQLSGPSGSRVLLDELGRLVERHKPDFIGLNEVLRDINEAEPFIFEFLKKYGYDYNHFAMASPERDDWLIGAGLCSKYPLNSVNDIVLGRDTPAARRGYPEQTLKAIAAKIKTGEKDELGLVVAHPIHLRPWTLRDHYENTSRLSALIRTEPYASDTIICGDFNEPGFMPKSFVGANSDLLNYKTGGFKNPTWRHNASDRTPIRANLDKLFWTKAGSLKLVDFNVISTDVSDHRPIIAKFEIGN